MTARAEIILGIALIVIGTVVWIHGDKKAGAL